MIKDIATGLEDLHCKGIVHGDVKGTNVLITGSGHAVLSDFGLSHSWKDIPDAQPLLRLAQFVGLLQSSQSYAYH